MLSHAEIHALQAGRHWTRMTRAEFAALPDRNDVRDYLKDTIYQDRENPGCVFWFEGVEGERDCLYPANILETAHGRRGTDHWTARDVQFSD